MHSRPVTRSDAGDDAGRRHFTVIHAVGRELAYLEERRALIDEPVHAVARQQLAARDVAFALRGGSAGDRKRRLGRKIVDELSHVRPVARKFLRVHVDRRGEDRHS